MGEIKEVRASILGQISLMQSVVAHLPDKISILKFICQGLKDIPGVKKAESQLCEDKIPVPPAVSENPAHHFDIRYKGHIYARLSFILTDPQDFAPYIPFLENFMHMLAIIFEEKVQRELNRTILENLEKKVYERTMELEAEIAERKLAEEHRKKLEDQLRQSQKMEAIGTLSGGIAHDFNNILGIIIGNTELAMEDTEEWNQIWSNLEEIKKASLRASDIVKQLLNFTRKTEQSKVHVDVQPIIKDAIKFLRSSIPATIDIQFNLPVLKNTILADPTQIYQILINLCTNAAHAMEKSGGILKIDLSEITVGNEATTQFQKTDAGTCIQLTVSDTGHGIDPDIRTRIFDPYFTTKEIGKGTGMGLSVVLGIVKNHNGTVSVDSKPGQGSVFKIVFPAAKGEKQTSKSTSDHLPTGNESILFIDDEESLSKLGSMLLQRLGYKVKALTDPVNALELIRAEPAGFDLVITDMTMPRLSGDQLIKEILNINSNMPVILCTGFSNKIDKEKAMMIGARCYIEKPLDKSKLAYCIREILD
ncbi:MAG: response regulator [Proteobacteria bacterium]|nr:response regulator [Pseudomonadota bacterium]MBU1389385.1 response regulator [Pseudomonadota bacterium]MBU1541205.1 response regulator [Pseudomonadota bacterium]MBU2429104.1 response regulator [Pseudomonadota bacterium]MBU2480188.1 response regulator [Pseudomonadota bacterium]